MCRSVRSGSCGELLANFCISRESGHNYDIHIPIIGPRSLQNTWFEKAEIQSK